jgi:zeta-carotene desaturase
VDASLGLPKTTLDDLYAAPAREFIEARGGEVRLNALARVAVRHGTVEAVTVRGEPLPPAGAVIAAVPWFGLPALLQDADGVLGPLLAAAAGTAASPIVTVNLWFDRPVMPAPFIGLPGRTMQWVFDTARIRPSSTPESLPTTPESSSGSGHLSLVSSGAEAVLRRSNHELIELACRELREALPAARAAGLATASVVREPQASFSIAPGQPARPGTRTPVAGLYLAGDWVDTGLPATIESAVVSGHRAADDILSGRAQEDGPARGRQTRRD